MMLRTLFLYAGIILLLAGKVAGAAETIVPVEYDRETNLLSVHVKEASLKEVLGRIAVKSGMEFQFHPDAEQEVTIEIKQRPLEAALKSLTRGLNTVLVHDTLPGEPQPILIGMQILPAGQHDSRGLQPLLNPEGEAFIQEKRRARLEEKARPPRARPGIRDYAEQRWLARLEKKPEEERQRLVEQARQKLDRKAAQKAAREEKRAKRKEERAAKHAAREAEKHARLEALKQQDPGYAARLEQRQAAVQVTLDELARQQQ